MGKQFFLLFFLLFSHALSFPFLIVFPPSSLLPFQREANGSFNTIDDSGVNAKFVNAVYDALLGAVGTHKQTREQEGGVHISPSHFFYMY